MEVVAAIVAQVRDPDPLPTPFHVQDLGPENPGDNPKWRLC